MKKIILIALITLITFGTINAQTAIGTDNPDSSAMLDVSSTTKGVLPPRMTKVQRDAIVNPAKGLLVYCTDCNAESMYLNLGTPAVPNWRPCTASTVANVTGVLHPTGISLTSNGVFNNTGSYIDLPPGKWMVNIVMILVGNANSWVRSSFSDNATTLVQTTDIVGSPLASGNSGPGALGEAVGFIIINNSTNAVKRYYYTANCDAGGAVNPFGGAANGENQIFAIPVN